MILWLKPIWKFYRSIKFSLLSKLGLLSPFQRLTLILMGFDVISFVLGIGLTLLCLIIIIKPSLGLILSSSTIVLIDDVVNQISPTLGIIPEVVTWESFFICGVQDIFKFSLNSIIYLVNPKGFAYDVLSSLVKVHYWVTTISWVSFISAVGYVGAVIVLKTLGAMNVILQDVSQICGSDANLFTQILIGILSFSYHVVIDPLLSLMESPSILTAIRLFIPDPAVVIRLFLWVNTLPYQGLLIITELVQSGTLMGISSIGNFWNWILEDISWLNFFEINVDGHAVNSPLIQQMVRQNVFEPVLNSLQSMVDSITRLGINPRGR